MNPNGNDIRQIKSGGYWHSNGRWSPNTQIIVCNTEEGTTTAGFEMVVMNIDGSNRVSLGWGDQMSWSPNANKIAFILSPMAELGLRYRFIYTVNSDGTGREQITTDSLEMIYTPCWSQDNSKIYFSSNRHNVSEPDSNEIYYMNSDGTDITRLTYTHTGSSYSPSISHSDRNIVFMSTRDAAVKGSIYSYNIQDSSISLITTPPSNEVYNSPRWSLDDQYIFFVGGSTDGTAHTSIYKIGIDGRNLTKLADDASSCDWSN